MKYYIIAGEPSGDLHASNLMGALKECDSHADFRFWGGDLMAAQGGTMVRHYKDTAVMGFIDVVLNLGKIRRNFALCRKDILENRPDVLILVDYPGFNLPMAEFAHKNGIRTFYYISPKVWASKEYRVKKMRRYIDQLYTIMPFETEFFKRHNIEVKYCGNPVMDAIDARPQQDESFDEFCQRNSLDARPKIALLAGSRKGEIGYNLPEMLGAIAEFPDYQFVIAGAPSFTLDDYQPYIADKDVAVVFDQTYQLVSHSRSALVTSGTATLETAILNCPQVVVYLMWGGGFSNWVAWRFIKTPFISLVNLILHREAVKELFQKAYSFRKMIDELKAITADGARRDKMLDDYDELRQIVGASGCSMRAAKWMTEYLKK